MTFASGIEFNRLKSALVTHGPVNLPSILAAENSVKDTLTNQQNQTVQEACDKQAEEFGVTQNY